MYAAVVLSSSSSAFLTRLCFPITHRRFPSLSKTMAPLAPSMPQRASTSAPVLAQTLTDVPADSPSVGEEPSKPKLPTPWLLVGLGNPGMMFRATKHNVGFEMLDAIAEAEGISMGSKSFKALIGKGFIRDVPVMLAKPQTFMNLSGESVEAIVSHYKIPLNQVLVIFDDLDLPFAKLRLLPKGGHGGHNGMRSVIVHFKGNCEFPRLRIGIGRPARSDLTANFVLSRFNEEESKELESIYQTGVEAVRILLLEGFDKSAKFVNTAKLVEPLLK